MITAKPFLKWAGGKRQLIDVLDRNLPQKIIRSGEIGLYVEPFIGGGAFLFHLLSHYKVKKSIINDINPDLMITYVVIQKYPEELIKMLEAKAKKYLQLNEDKRKEYYYKQRDAFNELKLDFNEHIPELWTKKASLLILLNKLCFNGLFRQNNKGEFNVPMGRYKNPKILDRENILNASKLLYKTDIHCTSYLNINPSKTENSLIYLDPPYRPLSPTSAFTKYSKEDFDDEDQKKLAEYFKQKDKEGFYLMLSNSDTGDGFFEILYAGYNMKKVKNRRYINSQADKRGEIQELLVQNY